MLLLKWSLDTHLCWKIIELQIYLSQSQKMNFLKYMGNFATRLTLCWILSRKEASFFLACSCFNSLLLVVSASSSWRTWWIIHYPENINAGMMNFWVRCYECYSELFQLWTNLSKCMYIFVVWMALPFFSFATYKFFMNGYSRFGMIWFMVHS